ncbi:hypothetical protein Angca_000605 [Angiostrongylus cantonensis]|nr:hypothetical protein Angca_000605 [Angiostrongylus cantonensis]
MASNITFYTDRLAQKEQELDELQAAFYKCKLKTKVKLDQLRKEVLSFCNDHGYSINENENHALLLIRVAENEAMLEASCRETEFLRNEMSRKQKQLNDQLILIKNLEEQLRASQPLSPLEIQERKRAAQMIDIDRIHQQIMFKDERIVELNNVILDKERQILDLQELCREQGEVASVTSQAARIVHKQWENRNRERRDVATETDTWLWNPVQPLQRELEPRARGDSPGRAVATRGSANTSPPPLDPSEVLERTGKCEENDDIPFPGSSNSLGKSPELDLSFRKKNRKRVTFDLLSDSQEHPPRIALDEHFTNVALELSSENERLQNELVEVTTSLEQLRERINESDGEMERVVREGKTQALKARVVAQARIKELEDQMAKMSEQHTEQVERLNTEIESLRSTREWEIEQNAQLRDQLNETKTKIHKLTEELDASEKANRDWEIKVSHGEEFLDQLIEDLIEAEGVIDYMEQQKHSILDDVDKLKDAIIAQDQLIEILEADIIIYEEHIGILRESLGASKIDHRSLLRSKAFETKLKALEKEKEQINRRCKEDRLRTKALDNKCRVLEQENEKLMAKLCELEMRERDEADMRETCLHLEQRLAEAEKKAAMDQAECEIRIETARLEAERKGLEAARLLEELLSAQQQIARGNPSSESRTERAVKRSESSHLLHTEEDVEEEQKNVTEEHIDTVEFRERKDQVNALQEEVEQLRVKYAEVAEELDAMHCTNFELMTKVTALEHALRATGNEKESWRKMYEKAVAEMSQKDHEKVMQNEEDSTVETELDESKTKLRDMGERAQSLEKELRLMKMNLMKADASLASYEVDLGDYKERVDRLEEELFAARSELDNARLGLQETTAVKKELEHLQEELEHERSYGRAKWEEVCKKVLEYESNSSESRKNSLEVINKVQHLEYMTAFEENITCLEKALQEAKNKIEQDKVEKKKLKLALKQLRDKMKGNDKSNDDLLPVSGTNPSMAIDEVVQVSVEPSTSASSNVNVEDLQNTIKTLELENRLSQELNTEYSRTMLEMEKEVITLKAQVSTLQEESKHFEMELKLHEILEDELEKELSQARLKNDEISSAMTTYEETLQQLNQQVDNDTVENDMCLKALKEEVTKLREQNRILNEKMSTISECASEEGRQILDTDEACLEEAKELSGFLNNGSHSHMRMRQTSTVSIFAESHENTNEQGKEINQSQLDQKTTQQTMVSSNATSPTSGPLLCVPVTEIGSVLKLHGDRDLSAEAAHVDSKQDFSNSQSPSIEANEDSSMGNVSTNKDLFAENFILRQCVNESNQMQKDLSESILDREQLQDRVVQLDSSLEAEKKRADALDCELSEQTELTEKATRQAAEAENESNRRLAECLEMETRREQVEKAYAQLSDYYSQLQAAYNVIYAQLKQLETERENNSKQQNASTSLSSIDNVLSVVDKMISELNLELECPNMDLHGKILLIQTTVRAKLAELEEHQMAIAEHRRTNEALHEQLRCIEEETQNIGGESRDSKARLLQLEGDLHWKQDECVSLRRKVDELQSTLNQLISRSEENDAAKLATRQADVDALFRANAELAHTNVRLQNELDQSEDRVVSTNHDVFCDGELQVELLRLRLNERSLLQQLAELQERFGDADGKMKKLSFEKNAQCVLAVESQLENVDIAENRLHTREEQLSLPPSSMELNVNESTELRNEVKRLEAVEKLLNERILCLEDQLLEGEERLQEIEEELADERQKGEVNKICLMQEAKKLTGDLWGGEELRKIRNELEKTRKELLEQKKLTVLLESSASEHFAASEVERSGHIQEMERVKCELNIVRQELEVAQERLRMCQASELRAEKQELGWELEDFQEMNSTEMSALPSRPKATDECDNIQKKAKEDRRANIDVMTDMCEDLESVETPRRNLEVVNEQFMELRRELTQAYQRISELELQIEQKVCALVDAEKELAVLREHLSKVENEKHGADIEMKHEEDGWGIDFASTEQTEQRLASERDRRKEAETLAGNLRAIASSLRAQIDDIQQKWLEEIQKVEDKQAEIEKLRSVIASRTELQEAEHQRSESELETLCEERRRVQDELTSAENEKIRLEEQLMSSKMVCDDLKTELQLLKSDYSELACKYEEIRRCYEDAQATLLTIDAEKLSFLERLQSKEKELDALHCQLETSYTHENEVDQQLTSKLREKEVHVLQLESSLRELQRQLEEKEVQNSLLKDSEARLLDSVDEYGLQNEKYQQEIVWLQKFVDMLKKERAELEEKLEARTKEPEHMLIIDSTSNASPTVTDESSLTDQRLESVITERDELLSRLKEAESRLNMAMEEKTSITRSYEQLRARLATRRQAKISAAETSRHSPTGLLEADLTQQQRTTNEPFLLLPVSYASCQVADSDVVRRRSGHH